MLNRICDFFKDRNKQLKPVNEWVVFLFLLIGGFVSFNVYVDYLVDQRVNKPETIDQLSSKIRPVVIFDSEKRIISGKDAFVNYLNDFDIEKDSKNQITEIIIYTKSLLTTAPILESLDDEVIVEEPIAEKFKWTYELSSKNLLAFDGPTKPRKVFRYRLEFIQ